MSLKTIDNIKIKTISFTNNGATYEVQIFNSVYVVNLILQPHYKNKIELVVFYNQKMSSYGLFPINKNKRDNIKSSEDEIIMSRMIHRAIISNIVKPLKCCICLNIDLVKSDIKENYLNNKFVNINYNTLLAANAVLQTSIPQYINAFYPVKLQINNKKISLNNEFDLCNNSFNLLTVFNNEKNIVSLDMDTIGIPLENVIKYLNSIIEKLSDEWSDIKKMLNKKHEEFKAQYSQYYEKENMFKETFLFKDSLLEENKTNDINIKKILLKLKNNITKQSDYVINCIDKFKYEKALEIFKTLLDEEELSLINFEFEFYLILKDILIKKYELNKKRIDNRMFNENRGFKVNNSFKNLTEIKTNFEKYSVNLDNPNSKYPNTIVKNGMSYSMCEKGNTKVLSILQIIGERNNFNNSNDNYNVCNVVYTYKSFYGFEGYKYNIKNREIGHSKMIEKILTKIINTKKFIGENTSIRMCLDVFSACGSTSIAGLIAALNTLKNKQIISTNDFICGVTVGEVGNTTVLDLNYIEDKFGNYDCKVFSNIKDEIVGIFLDIKPGHSISIEKLQSILKLAIENNTKYLKSL